jgi:3',5'-cyclic AMP phosphodiesterase CpdA
MKHTRLNPGVLFFALMVLCAAFRNVHAQAANDHKPFFIIQLSDPQIGFYKDSTALEVARYKKAVAIVNRLHPDFVVITGDLINNAGNEDQLTKFRHVTAMVDPDIPVFLTPGNHDVGNTPTVNSVEYYKSLYGYDRFSFMHKGIRFIGFNTSLANKKAPRDLRDEQYIWLVDELKRSRDAKQIFVFGHIPLFLDSASEPDLYYDKAKTELKNMETSERMKYLKLFEKYHVNAVITGHMHRNEHGQYKDVKMITTSAVGEALGKDPRGLRIFVFDNNKMSEHFYSLDDVPDHVNLEP